jgi:hypothetical protein
VSKANHHKGPGSGMARIGGPGGELWVEQLAKRIADIESLLSFGDDPTCALDYSDAALASVASRLYRSRRRRARHFDAEMFAEPAWDMLLDLFIAKVRGKQMRTQSLCLASEVPETTALRWIGVLERNGLVARHLAEHDHRLRLIALTPKGYRVMRQYLMEGIEASDLPTGGGFE